jgi:hypothetical protein
LRKPTNGWWYYWIYYSGHGSSSGGKWCLPENTRVDFEDVRDVWKESQAAKRGARLIIVSDSCYAGQWCEALKASGDQNIAIQAASVQLPQIWDGTVVVSHQNGPE